MNKELKAGDYIKSESEQYLTIGKIIAAWNNSNTYEVKLDSYQLNKKNNSDFPEISLNRFFQGSLHDDYEVIDRNTYLKLRNRILIETKGYLLGLSSIDMKFLKTYADIGYKIICLGSNGNVQLSKGKPKCTLSSCEYDFSMNKEFLSVSFDSLQVGHDYIISDLLEFTIQKKGMNNYK